MQARIHPAAGRGHADHGWLDSHHTFSFAGFHDPTRMGFRHLRVINDDVVAPARGFGTHPHRDMEIVSVPVRGRLAHRDTLGTGSTITPGEIQLMSAGRGIAHSEMNPSPDEEVNFLQIWILPETGGTEPSYQQKDFGLQPGVKRVLSPDGRDGSLVIKQDVDLWRVIREAGSTVEVPLARPYTYVHVIAGRIEVEGAQLSAGDGIELDRPGPLVFSVTEDTDVLVFDLV